MRSICIGRAAFRDVFQLCRKDSVEGCVPDVQEGQCRSMCSGCVGRAALREVFELCRKGSVEGCVRVV